MPRFCTTASEYTTRVFYVDAPDPEAAEAQARELQAAQTWPEGTDTYTERSVRAEEGE